jgi:hypothetical protein
MAFTVAADFSAAGSALPSFFGQTRFYGPGATTVSTVTSDGKTVPQLLAEAVRVCTWNPEVASNRNWGTIAAPTTYCQYGIAIQDAIVAAGGGWALKPGIGPRGLGRTTGDPASSPAAIPNNQAADTDPKPFSPVGWVGGWTQWGVDRWTAPLLKGIYLDNEWANRTPAGYLPYWYTTANAFPTTDWGYVNTRYYNAAVQAIVATDVYGHDYSVGASKTPASDFNPQMLRWLYGTGMTNIAWSGGTYSWPHGSADNAHIAGLQTAIHAYNLVGQVSGLSTVTAASFTQTARDFLNQYCTNVNFLRANVPAGHKMAQEEWWMVKRRTDGTTDTTSTSREALGHLIGYMLHAAKAQAWNCAFVLFWGIGPNPYPGTTSPDSWLMTSGSNVIRMPAFYAIKDICKHAEVNYPIVVGSAGLGSTNTDGKLSIIQKSADGATGCVIVANISAATETLTVTGFDTITSVKKVPTAWAVETGLTDLGAAVPATIAQGEALYIQGTLTAAPPPPPPPPPTIRLRQTSRLEQTSRASQTLRKGQTARLRQAPIPAAPFDVHTGWQKQPWNADATAQSVDAASATMIAAWIAHNHIHNPNVTTNSFSQAWVVGRQTDPHYTVTITNGWGQHADPDIPIPLGTLASPDSDMHLVVIDLENNREHDFWQMTYDAATDTWTAGSGFSYDLGDTYPSGGANAAGFPPLATAIWPEEIQNGLIPHVLSFSVYGTAANAPYGAKPTVFRYPATHTDGTGVSDDLPEGVWLALPSNAFFNNAWADWVKVVWQALVDYGMFLIDQGGSLGITGVNPVNGGVSWSSVGMGTGGSQGFPGDFPWTSMRVLDPPATP